MRKEERGRDNRHSRRIKTRQGETVRRAAQHGQIEELNMLWDCIAGPFQATAAIFSVAPNYFISTEEN